jgi:hypothetical protein
LNEASGNIFNAPGQNILGRGGLKSPVEFVEVNVEGLSRRLHGIGHRTLLEVVYRYHQFILPLKAQNLLGNGGIYARRGMKDEG